MKKVISVLFIVLVFSACGGTKQRKINIAVVGKDRTPYWNYVELGAKAAGDHLGVSVESFAPVEEDPASWQIRQMEELIARPVDGIAFGVSNLKSLAPTILKAMQSNIPCVAMDTDVDKNRHVYIGTSDYQAGRQAGEELLSMLGSKGRIAIVTSFSGSADSLKRVRGFRDVIADNAGIEIVSMAKKENNAVQIADVESLLTSYPYLDGILYTSDLDGVTVAEAVQKVDKAGQIKIVGIGESPDIMTYVQNNVIQLTVARKPYAIGYLSVQVLHNMAKVGISNTLKILPESGMIDTGTALVTPANVLQYREELMKPGTELSLQKQTP